MNKGHDEEKRDPEGDLAEEINFEPEEELGDLGAAKAKLRKLKDELEKAKKERQEYLDGWQRCKADAINSRKDLLAEAKRTAQREKQGLIEEIVPILDSFDMAAASEQWALIDDGFRTGMENVRNQLHNVFSRNGIERYGAVGDTYNPHLHEAIEERTDVAGEPNTIVRILRYGYRSADRVIRAAQVIIKGV